MKNALSGKRLLVVDGVIYGKQAHGGISRVYSELLPRVLDMNPGLCVKMICDAPLLGSLPDHRAVLPVRYDRLRRLIPKRWAAGAMRVLKPILIARDFGDGEGCCWLSTYYTLPGTWRGRIISVIHDLNQEKFPELFAGIANDDLRREKKRSVLAADTIICVSCSTRDDVVEYYGVPKEKIHVIHHGYSAVFRKKDAMENMDRTWTGEPFILYVGSRAHYKKFDTLLEAYGMWTQRKCFKLVVAGQAWRQNELDLQKRLGVADRVVLVSDASDETLSRLYNDAAAFVLPSLYEGFGIPLLEAMACGCPIVASRIPSTVEVAGDCAEYFEAGDSSGLAGALETVIRAGRNSDRVSDGLARVRNFSWDKAADEFVRVLNLCQP